MARKVATTKARKADSTPEKRIRRNSGKSAEVIAIISLAMGVFIGVAMFSKNTGLVGDFFRNLLMALWGKPAYLVFATIIGMSLHYIFTKNGGRYGYKYWVSALMLAFVSSGWHMFFTKGIAKELPLARLADLGAEGVGGGILGGMLAMIIDKLMGQIGGGIFIITGLLIMSVLVFEISILKVCRWIGSGFVHIWQQITAEREHDDDEEEDEYDKAYYAKAEIREEDFAPPPPKKVAKEIKIELPERSEKKIEIIEKKKEETEIITSAAMAERVEVEISENTNEFTNYKLPPLSLLKPSKKGDIKKETKALEDTARKLISTLSSFGVEAEFTDWSVGPTVTRYEIKPSDGVRLSKISGLASDIALNLGAVGVRIEPIPGKVAVGIEVPNTFGSTVNIREVIGDASFANFGSKLAFALGKDIGGETVVADIARMPHLLVAGSTGSGKSVCINTLITSVMYKAMPNEVKLILIDPKMVELGRYNSIPHLLIPVVTDAHKAAGALQWAVKEMLDRYKKFAQNNVRDLRSFNALMKDDINEQLPQIVIVIDELADLIMVAKKDVEDSIQRLSQMARAAGMYLVLATQRPTVDVITGTIKNNIPSRISFLVSSQIDSRTILDSNGAESLLGRGDMLYLPVGASNPLRVQGAFVSDEEVDAVIEYVKSQSSEAAYDEDVVEHVNKYEVSDGTHIDASDSGDADALLPQAIELALEKGQASVAMYQRWLKVGYQRAARIIDQMEERGIIGSFDGTKPRQGLISRQEYQEMLMRAEDGVTV